MERNPQTVGRFAPSPTGPLHVGSLVAAVGSFCLARQGGGRWLVRMEDLDEPRVVPGADGEILATLERLGLTWDGPVVYQSRRTEAYRAALERLEQRGLVFPCGCTRREILASAPHPGEEGPVYPGTCRGGLPRGRAARAVRLRVHPGAICFDDGLYGRREQCLVDAVGDFVLRRADGLFAYQLAVVVDDADAGVNQVVRGGDLLGSTPRQVYLHACLDLPVPRYVHLPLAVTPSGEKISKRDRRHSEGGERTRGEVWSVLAFLGQEPPPELGRAADPEVLAWGVEHFRLARVPCREQLVWTGNF